MQPLNPSAVPQALPFVQNQACSEYKKISLFVKGLLAAQDISQSAKDAVITELARGIRNIVSAPHLYEQAQRALKVFVSSLVCDGKALNAAAEAFNFCPDFMYSLTEAQFHALTCVQAENKTLANFVKSISPEMILAAYTGIYHMCVDLFDAFLKENDPKKLPIAITVFYGNLQRDDILNSVHRDVLRRIPKDFIPLLIQRENFNCPPIFLSELLRVHPECLELVKARIVSIFSDEIYRGSLQCYMSNYSAEESKLRYDCMETALMNAPIHPDNRKSTLEFCLHHVRDLFSKVMLGESDYHFDYFLLKKFDAVYRASQATNAAAVALSSTAAADVKEFESKVSSSKLPISSATVPPKVVVPEAVGPLNAIVQFSLALADVDRKSWGAHTWSVLDQYRDELDKLKGIFVSSDRVAHHAVCVALSCIAFVEKQVTSLSKLKPGTPEHDIHFQGTLFHLEHAVGHVNSVVKMIRGFSEDEQKRLASFGERQIVDGAVREGLVTFLSELNLVLNSDNVEALRKLIHQNLDKIKYCVFLDQKYFFVDPLRVRLLNCGMETVLNLLIDAGFDFRSTTNGALPGFYCELFLKKPSSYLVKEYVLIIQNLLGKGFSPNEGEAGVPFAVSMYEMFKTNRLIRGLGPHELCKELVMLFLEKGLDVSLGSNPDMVRWMLTHEETDFGYLLVAGGALDSLQGDQLTAFLNEFGEKKLIMEAILNKRKALSGGETTAGVRVMAMATLDTTTNIIPPVAQLCTDYIGIGNAEVTLQVMQAFPLPS